MYAFVCSGSFMRNILIECKPRFKLHDTTVSDFAELARLGHVSRARITQTMNLLQLAPDLQEAILFLPPVETGKDPVTERELREVVQVVSWEEQRGGR